MVGHIGLPSSLRSWREHATWLGREGSWRWNLARHGHSTHVVVPLGTPPADVHRWRTLCLKAEVRIR